ncbi:unnamed protein product [Nezara viridula]|uniref:Uncharacterized protein n=1 Tax=Nezara viridula TaxID=85310 RepID=A0A9P0MPZ7_NEZVI|nr:unnamed protein product [Nezara viridula]
MQKLKELQEEAQSPGLKINAAKTQEMRMNRSQENFFIEDEIIESATEFCYLRSMVSQDGGADEDVENHIRKVQKAFSQLCIFKTNVILDRNPQGQRRRGRPRETCRTLEKEMRSTRQTWSGVKKLTKDQNIPDGPMLHLRDSKN